MKNWREPSFSSIVIRIYDGVLRPDSDGLVNIPGVLAELDLESSLDLVFPPELSADPVACSKHFVVTLHNDNVGNINDLVFSRIVEWHDLCFEGIHPSNIAAYRRTVYSSNGSAPHVY